MGEYEKMNYNIAVEGTPSAEDETEAAKSVAEYLEWWGVEYYFYYYRENADWLPERLGPYHLETYIWADSNLHETMPQQQEDLKNALEAVYESSRRFDHACDANYFAVATD